jgi:hypothetical protein
MRNTLAWAREEAIRLYRIYWAIGLLAHQISAPELKRQDLAEQLESIQASKSKKHLQSLARTLREKIRTLRERLEILATDDDLLSFLSNVEKGPEGELVWVPVDFLSKLSRVYERLQMPAHWRVGIDPQGSRPPNSIFETRALEVTLFEDVCALFNLTKRQADALGGRPFPKEALKTLNALLRSTSLFVFFFVESYLNGIAYDHFIRSGDSLNEDEIELLAEWSISQNKVRQKTTRDKLLQYPKIITGAKHPLLQESNCPELKIIVESAKHIRDAIVHGSPFPRMDARQNRENWLDKETLIYTLTLAQVEQIVDAAIVPVRKIHTLIGKAPQLDWLKDRDKESALFPSSTFD